MPTQHHRLSRPPIPRSIHLLPTRRDRWAQHHLSPVLRPPTPFLLFPTPSPPPPSTDYPSQPSPHEPPTDRSSPPPLRPLNPILLPTLLRINNLPRTLPATPIRTHIPLNSHLRLRLLLPDVPNVLDGMGRTILAKTYVARLLARSRTTSTTSSSGRSLSKIVRSSSTTSSSSISSTSSSKMTAGRASTACGTRPSSPTGGRACGGPLPLPFPRRGR